MPYLYGQPFKHELRAEIRAWEKRGAEYQAIFQSLLKEKRELTAALRSEQTRREELEQKLTHREQKLSELERKLGELTGSLAEFRTQKSEIAPPRPRLRVIA